MDHHTDETRPERGTMYLPLHQSDHRHDDGTGWRGAVALFVVMMVIAAGHAVATAASPLGTSRTTCTPAVKTIGGAPARVFCGPAKATAKVGSTAYRFAGGACQKAPGFSVNVGTLSFASSARVSYFGISLPKAKPGTYTGTQVTLSFNVGKQRHSLVSSAGAKVVLGPGVRSGTFAGKDLLGKAITGSFTC
jgi:hypothetical protein